jgi:hypothetical protein
VLVPGRPDKRYCSNRCRAAASKRRAVQQAEKHTLERVFTDPAFVDGLPKAVIPAVIDAVDVLRGRLIARLSVWLEERGTLP